MNLEEFFDKLHDMLDEHYVAIHEKVSELTSSGDINILVKLSGLLPENGSSDHRQIKDKGNLVTSLRHLEVNLKDSDPLKHAVKRMLDRLTDEVRGHTQRTLVLRKGVASAEQAFPFDGGYNNESWFAQIAHILIDNRDAQRDL